MKIKIFFSLIIFYFLPFEKIYAKNIKILVKIENELITNYDIKRKIITTLVLANKEISQKNIDDLKNVALENLILHRLKKIELKKYNIKKDNNQINSYLNSVSSNNIENFKSLFKKNNLDFDAYVDEIDTEFRWNRLIFNKFSKKIEIKPDDIDREVKKIMKKKTKSIKFNLSEIEFLANEDDNFNNKKIIEVKNEIENFGFESAVIKFSLSPTSSNKGELGWIQSTALSKEILKILDDLKIGEISKPIFKQDKIILLKLNDKEISDFSNMNLEKFKKDLVNQKKNELFNLYSNSYLSKLRNTNFIEYNR